MISGKSKNQIRGKTKKIEGNFGAGKVPQKGVPIVAVIQNVDTARILRRFSLPLL